MRQGGNKARKAKSHTEVVIISRRQQVADLLVQSRLSVRQIAGQLGVSVGTVAADKKALFEEWRTEARRKIEELVLLEWRALDGLERECHGWLLEATDPDERCKLVDRLVKIQESRRKLLGLDAPEKLQMFEAGADATRGVIVDLEGLPALIPGPDDREGYEAAEVE